MTMVVAKSAESRVVEALTECFWLSGDGYWYPLASGSPLVRIRVSEGTYKIDRRRNVNESWLRLAEALVAEFDPETFQTWASNWKLTAN
jgi:hypothetical protein